MKYTKKQILNDKPYYVNYRNEFGLFVVGIKSANWSETNQYDDITKEEQKAINYYNETMLEFHLN